MGKHLNNRILKVLRNMPRGTHLCHFYQTPQDMLDVLVPYFAAGLKKREKCLWIVDGVITVDQAKAAMAAAVPDWNQYLEAGQIEFFEHTNWYVIGGEFEKDRVLDQYLKKEIEARETGYTGLRLTGNTLWARNGSWPDLLEYERHVDQCFCNHNMTAICTYPLEGCAAVDIVDVAKAHELVLIRRDGTWDIIESATLRQMREELRESHERLKTLAQQIVQVEQKERRRVSQALHDGLQQTIVATQLSVDRARNKTGPDRDEAIDRVSALLGEALTACRTLTTEISPPILHERGLVPALEWLASWFSKQHRLNVVLRLPATEPSLEDSERTTLFEVARELLFNVVKHAEVTEANLTLQTVDDRAELVVEDQGVGSNRAGVNEEDGDSHFGFFSIRERLRMLDGDFFFESQPGRGSRSIVHLPLAVVETVGIETANGNGLSPSCTVGEETPGAPAHRKSADASSLNGREPLRVR